MKRKVVHAHWIEKDGRFVIYPDSCMEQYRHNRTLHRVEHKDECSYCHCETMHDASIYYAYCPHCGARMDEED